MADLIDLIFTPRCLGCQTLGEHLCLNCVRGLDLQTTAAMPQVDSLITAGEYDGWLRETLISYKSGHREYGKGLGKVLKTCIDSFDREKSFQTIPIPTSRSKRLERGYDTISNLLRFTELPAHQIESAALTLKVGIRDQVGLSARERRVNLRNAFRANKPISGTVILVDDVVTTGATLTEAAKAVRLAGASRVLAIAICGSKNWR